MKKVFAILAIACFMAACNNKSEKKEGDNKDTTKMENKMSNDTSSKMSADTTKK